MGIPVIVVSQLSPSPVPLTEFAIFRLLQRLKLNARNWLEVARYASFVDFRTHAHWAVQVYAAGSEDMDTLTFSAPILFRHLTFSEAKKQPISEINLKAALEGLDMDMSQVGFE
jgi:hypothetical protein